MSALDDKILVDYLINAHRVQRHDFLNYFQVISGYLQLGKPERAQEFMSNTSAKLVELGKISRLNYPALIAVILNTLGQLGLDSEGVNVKISTTMQDYKGNDKVIAQVVQSFWQGSVNDISLGKCSFDLEICEEKNNYAIKMLCHLKENAHILKFSKELVDQMQNNNISHDFNVDTGKIGLNIYFSK